MKIYELHLTKKEINYLLEFVESDIENAEQSFKYKENPSYISKKEYNKILKLKDTLTFRGEIR